ncbi:MAG: class I SAM-dependent methyltransferase [Burkholderiaceae bacterium]
MTVQPVPDTWQLGEPYERFMGRWSRLLATRFLAWLAQRHGLRWLDVGCGTGALCMAIADRASPRQLFGVEPSAGFVEHAHAALGQRATLIRANAESLPLPDAAVDITVSSLVLNVLPDAPAALREMRRVTHSGGIVAAAVWDYALRMRALRLFWDAAISIDAAAERLDEGMRYPICQSEALAALFARAGLQQVRAGAVEIETRFSSFDDYWQPFLGGQGPAPSYVAGLDDARRQRLRRALRSRVPVGPGGAISLAARAWVVRGVVA